MYEVVFLENDFIVDIENIFQIIIDKKTDAVEPLDFQVFITINVIVGVFFENSNNALLYTCSSEEGKEQKRFDKFDRWYNRSENKKLFVKIDSILPISEDMMFYASIICHNDNPNLEEIKIKFKEFEESIDPDK